MSIAPHIPNVYKADQQWLAFWMDHRWPEYENLPDDSARLKWVIEKFKGYRRAVGSIDGG